MPFKRIRDLSRSLKKSFQRYLGRSHLLKLSEIDQLNKHIELTEQELIKNIKYTDRGLLSILCILYKRKGEAELRDRLNRRGDK